MQLTQTFSVPTEMKAFKFVMFIAKTTSKKYPFIIMETQKCNNYTREIDGQTWHIVGFNDEMEDLKGFYNLLKYTEGLQNVFVFENGMLWEQNHHSIFTILDCAKKALSMSDSCVYCCEKQYKSKEEIDHPTRISISLGAEFDKMMCILGGKEYKKPKFIHIKGLWLTNPCHQINLSHYICRFNPYLYVEDGVDLVEAYKAFALKQNPSVFHCPFFKIENLFCEFIDEHYHKGDNS